MSPRIIWILLVLGAAACGGDPEAEATWETYTTAPDDSAGGEQGEADE